MRNATWYTTTHFRREAKHLRLAGHVEHQLAVRNFAGNPLRKLRKSVKTQVEIINLMSTFLTGLIPELKSHTSAWNRPGRWEGMDELLFCNAVLRYDTCQLYTRAPNRSSFLVFFRHVSGTSCHNGHSGSWLFKTGALLFRPTARASLCRVPSRPS